MWFYSFVFAATIVSASCSAVAIVQLLRDQSRIRESMHESELVQNKSTIISRVVLRCVMYTFGKTEVFFGGVAGLRCF